MAHKVFELRDERNRRYLADTVRDGTFTAFLGAGASSLRPQVLDLKEHPWRDVADAITAVRRELDRGQSQDRDAAYLYLRSFAEQRLRLSPTQLDELLPVGGSGEPEWPSETGSPSSWPDPKLVRFQCQLAQTGADMGLLFGHAFSTSHAFISQLSDCSVTLRDSDERLHRLQAHLRGLVDAASALDGDCAVSPYPMSVPPTLRHAWIRRKVLTLALELMTEGAWKEPDAKEWKSHYENSIEQSVPQEQKKSRATVCLWLSRIQWVSDLLWYSLRYWIPQYPTTGELAFELSLVSEYGPPRRVELAQAAEAAYRNPDSLIDEMRSILTCCEENASPLSSFHEFLARVLVRMYGDYEGARTAYDSGAVASGVIPTLRHIPLLFTTNFDRAVEKALERIEAPYHVVYPLVSIRSTKTAESPRISRRRVLPHVSWRFKTWHPREDPIDKPCHQKLAGERILGPIVVKLHGSPLEKLASGSTRHWLVLSESGYLEALDPGTHYPTPPWTAEELKGTDRAGQRSLWFMGYSVTDWNIRLQLYEHIRYSSDATPPPTKSVIDRGTIDQYKDAILDRLNIDIGIGDLNRFPFWFGHLVQED